MELAIPLLAMGGLYIATNQDNNERSGFTNRSRLPNVDIQDQNFPEMQPNESEPTSKLSTVNRYDGRQAYTDKYFAPPAESTSTTKWIIDSFAEFWLNNINNSSHYISWSEIFS